MDREGIHEFVRDTLHHSRVKDEGEWVMTNCPLATYLHEGGTDNSASFGIKVNPHDNSVFHCFTCKSKGNLKMLLESLEEYTGEDYTEEIDSIDKDEDLNATLPEWGKRITHDSKYKKLGEPVSDDYLDLYEPAAGHKYLRKRGIEDWASDQMGLCIDPNDGHGQERILFPVFSHTGGFYGYTGRAVKNVDPKVRDYFGLPKKHLLLGSHLLSNSDQDHVVLVEGLFDYANLLQFGAPVVAVMHSGLTLEQAAVLKDIGLPVYVMFDNDKAGRVGRTVVRDELELHIPLMKVQYPREKTVLHKKSCKMRAPDDPGELNSDQYYTMMDDARLL